MDLVDFANEALEKKCRPSIKLDQLRMKGFAGMDALPLIMVAQTEGGPDHNTQFLRSQLAAFATFLLL